MQSFNDPYQVCKDWAPLVGFGSLSQLQEYNSGDAFNPDRHPEDMTLKVQSVGATSRYSRTQLNGMPADYMIQFVCDLVDNKDTGQACATMHQELPEAVDHVLPNGNVLLQKDRSAASEKDLRFPRRCNRASIRYGMYVPSKHPESTRCECRRRAVTTDNKMMGYDINWSGCNAPSTPTCT